MSNARVGISEMQDHVDTLIVIKEPAPAFDLFARNLAR